LNGQNLVVQGGDISVIDVLAADVNSGTVTLSGTGNLGGSGNTDVYNIILSGATTLAGNINVNNDLTISGSNSLNVSASDYNINVGGSWSNASGTFTPQEGTVTFNGSSVGKTIDPGSSSFYNLTFNGSGGWTLSADTTTTNNFTISSGTATSSSGILSVAGNFDVSGGTFKNNSGKVLFNSSNAQTITTGGTGNPFHDIQFNGSGGWTFAIGNHDINNNFTITQGTVTSTAGILEIGGSWLNSSTFNNNSGTVKFDATTGSKTINNGSSSFYSLTFDGVDGGWQISTSDLDVNNNLNITNGTLDASSQNITLAGNLVISSGASFTKGTGTTTFDGSGSNTWTDNNASKQDMGQVEINGTSKTITLNSDVKITKLIIASDNTFDAGTYTFAITGSGTGASRPFIINGTFSANASLAEYTGTSTTDVESTSYYNLKLNQSGTTFQLYNNVTTTNDINITNGTLDVTTNNYDLSVGGNWTNDESFTARNGTVILNGTSQQTLSGTLINSSAFNVLVITNNSGTDAQTDPSIIFATSTTAVTSTVTVGSVKLRFNASSTFTFTNINWNGQATSTRVTLRSSSAGTQWYLIVTSSQIVLY